MKFETKIKTMLEHPAVLVDDDQFLYRLHQKQHKREISRYRMISGLSALALILVIGFFTINQLDNEFIPGYEYYYIAEESLDDEVLAELALFLVDESEDVWSAIEFLNEVNYDPITYWMEELQ